jgi:hypothetical protein
MGLPEQLKDGFHHVHLQVAITHLGTNPIELKDWQTATIMLIAIVTLEFDLPP